MSSRRAAAAAVVCAGGSDRAPDAAAGNAYRTVPVCVPAVAAAAVAVAVDLIAACRWCVVVAVVRVSVGLQRVCTVHAAARKHRTRLDETDKQTNGQTQQNSTKTKQYQQNDVPMKHHSNNDIDWAGRRKHTSVPARGVQ